MGSIYDFVPLQFALAKWPGDSFSVPEQLDSIGIANAGFDSFTGTAFVYSGTIQCLDEIEFALPLIPGVSFVFLQDGDLTEVDFALTYDRGDFELCLEDLQASVRIESGLLKKVEEVGGTFEVVEGIDGNPEPVEISFQGAEACIHSSGEFDFTFDESAPELSISTFMIGDSGIVLETTGLSLILSEEAAQGLPESIDDDWRGVFIDEATIHLPEGLSDILPDNVELDDFFIGSGGFCGTVTGNWESEEDAPEESNVFGIPFQLSSVSLEFKQNTIVDSSIRGTLTLPFFDAALDVEISLTNDGDFGVALTSDSADGIATVSTDFFELQLTSVGFSKEDDEFFVTLGGTIALDIDGIELPRVSLDGIRINSDGKIAMDGGGITLSQQEVIDLYGFQIDVDSIGFGTDDDWRWIGFSGGIKLTDALPVGVAAKGLQILWNPDGTGSPRIRCDGIGVAFEIPEVLSFEGAVSLADQEFQGAVLLNLKTMDMSIDGRLIVGEAEEGFKYFYVELAAQLPMGIPLGSTGLALYGFSGLHARNMAPTQEGEDFNWYEDWYQAEQPWSAEEGSTGFGVGTTLGTLPDNGFSFATEVALVLVFPGPIVMLQGVGNILRARSDLEERTLFDSLIVFDGNAGTILAALGMQYVLPEDTSVPDGMILDAAGSAEAFFDFNNASNWHVYLGEKDEDKRVRAEALSIFEADAYLMLDSDRLAAGVSIGYDKTLDFEVVVIALTAWISGAAELSWAPQHLAGELDFGGRLAFRVCGVGFDLSAEAGIEASTPTPYRFALDLTVSIDLPWPLGDIDVNVELEWEEAADPEAISPVLSEVSIRDYKTTESWLLEITGEPNESNADTWYPKYAEGHEQEGDVVQVPLDSRPVLLFNRNVSDRTGVGTPAPDTSVEVVNDSFELEYDLSDLVLQKWDSEDDEWGDEVELFGSWQATGEEAGTQVELFGDGPFSFCRETISNWTGSSEDDPGWTPYVDGFLSAYPTYPIDLTPMEVDFEDFSAYDNLGSSFTHEEVDFTAEDGSGNPLDILIIDTTSRGGGKGVLIQQNIQQSLILTVEFPEAVKPEALTLFPFEGRGWFEVEGIFDDGRTPVDARFDLRAGVEDYILDERFSGVRRVKLTGQDAHLLKLSYVLASTLAEADELADSVTTLVGVRYVLEPDTDYRLTIETKTYTNGSVSNSEEAYAYFRTSGPPTDLTPYIDESVPSGDAPHYGAYDLVVSFNENYLKEFYGSTPELELNILDENGQSASADGEYSLGWRAGVLGQSYFQAVWIAALEESGVRTDPTAAEADNILYGTIGTDQSLPAGAGLNAEIEYEGETIYSFVVQTSRYADFTSLIEDFNSELWNEVIPGGTLSADDLTTLGGIADERAGAGLGFDVDEGGTFEEVFYDRLAITPRSLPEAPEMTAITDTTGAILALLLELPEPVEWDRVSMTATRSDGSEVTCGALRNIDQSRALLFMSDGSGSLPHWEPEEYSFKFTFTLDLGDDDHPVLYRRGSTSRERPNALTLNLS